MGRLLLIGVVVAGLAACEPAAEEAGAPHADLTCAECHTGPEGERGRATVPESACLECHEDAGPAEVELATVTFPHRNHTDESEIEATCAACHTHETGEAPLVTTVDGCALCHLGQIQTAEAQECRLCHQQPDHSQLTAQGVAISHSQLPWLEIGCVRCHYDVAEARTEVSGLTCSECHEDMAVLNERAVGRDLHPIHEGLTCTACHEEDLHEVQEISSAVELVCSDCHLAAHELVADSTQWLASAVCAGCHTGVHAPQQRLVLGIRPGGDVTPSEKFLAGITCRSCHIPPEAPVGPTMEPVRGQATSCAGCHEDEYVQVLDWWIEGVEARLETTSAYVARASREVGAHSDSAAALVSLAGEMLELVEDAGGQHNLELSDRMMREAVDRAAMAYRLAGRTAPTQPNLGRTPHAGLCSYCHYSPDEPWDFESMPEDFHQGLVTDPNP